MKVGRVSALCLWPLAVQTAASTVSRHCDQYDIDENRNANADRYATRLYLSPIAASAIGEVIDDSHGGDGSPDDAAAPERGGAGGQPESMLMACCTHELKLVLYVLGYETKSGREVDMRKENANELPFSQILTRRLSAAATMKLLLRR